MEKLADWCVLNLNMERSNIILKYISNSSWWGDVLYGPHKKKKSSIYLYKFWDRCKHLKVFRKNQKRRSTIKVIPCKRPNSKKCISHWNEKNMLFDIYIWFSLRLGAKMVMVLNICCCNSKVNWRFWNSWSYFY